MKIKLLCRYNKLIGLLLAILGFSNACIKSPLMEYGSPSADFMVKGTITSEKDGSALQNIRVVMTDSTRLADTVYTDKNGNYILDIKAFPDNHTFNILAEDVDGATNGEFQSGDTKVEFTNPKYSGGDGNWYHGKTSQDLNIILKPKQ